MSETENKTFEEDLQALESVVDKLERGNLPLADSLSAFEDGMKLAERAETRLAEAEERVEVLVKGEDGVDRAEPFEEHYPDVDLAPSDR